MAEKEKKDVGPFNLKGIIFSILGLALTAIIISIIPLYTYYDNFNGPGLSNMPSDWAEFGTYLSGTSGVILSFFAVVFALASIIFTTIIAKKLQDRELDFNTKQADTQLKLKLAQSKPFPYIDLARLPKRTSITLQNMGVGSLKITEIKIIYKGVEQFDHFRALFDVKIQFPAKKGAKVYYNSAPTHALAPNTSKVILEITPRKDKNNYKTTRALCRNILKDCKVIFQYEDFYENKDTYEKELSFLRDQPKKNKQASKDKNDDKTQ